MRSHLGQDHSDLARQASDVVVSQTRSGVLGSCLLRRPVRPEKA
jgi:hypothetical protein